jgi:signal transduction histidine kinase
MPELPAPTELRRERFAGSRVAFLIIAIVIVALLSLSVGPSITDRTLQTLRARTDSTSGQAQAILADLNQLMLQGIVEHQNIRLSRTESALARYRAIRDSENVKLDEIVLVARRAGPATLEHADALRRLARRWHAASDERVDGRISEPQFLAAMPQVEAGRDSVFSEARELTDDFRDFAARDFEARGVVLQRQRTVSLSVGVLALCAVMALLWFARHDRRLTRALEQALAEEATLRAQAEARRLELEAVTESRTRLMRGFTHDVKNPMGAADGFLQLLQDGILDPLTPRQTQAVTRSRALLASALRLIGDLLDVARTERDGVTVDREAMDVVAVTTDVVEEYRPLATHKRLALSLECAAGALLVHSDPARVRQVLGNLLSNAVKYTPQGSIVVRVRPPHDRADDHERRVIAIDVTDSGVGIRADEHALLFREFVRLHPSASEGAGVGLAISQRVAHALGGEITVASEPGRGSTFTFRLPARAEVSAMAGDVHQTPRSSDA